MLNVIMLNVIMLKVIVLNVLVPFVLVPVKKNFCVKFRIVMNLDSFLNDYNFKMKLKSRTIVPIW
jgi:hypothetical protein